MTTPIKFQVFANFNYQAFQNNDWQSGMEVFASQGAAMDAMHQRFAWQRDYVRSVGFESDGTAFIIDNREYLDFDCEDREFVYMDLRKGESLGFDADGIEKWFINEEPYARLTVGPRGGILKERV